MNFKRVLILGATGLVGREILRQLSSDSSITDIFILTRRSLSAELKGPKVRECVMDFDALDVSAECFAVDAVFCAIGTTIKKAGNQENFKKVDYGYPLKIAEISKSKGAKNFFLVSALGADAKSMIFYNRVKGELERDLQKLNFDKLIIIRPSILLGKRPGDHRAAEEVAQWVGRYLPKVWRAVPPKNIVAAMIRAADNGQSGTQIIENKMLSMF